jgi:hypothetical protein
MAVSGFILLPQPADSLGALPVRRRGFCLIGEQFFCSCPKIFVHRLMVQKIKELSTSFHELAPRCVFVERPRMKLEPSDEAPNF